MQNARLDESQAGIKIVRRNINNLRYADDTTLMAECEEEVKSLLMRVKEESEKVALKLNLQKTKIMVSGHITSWQIGGAKGGNLLPYAVHASTAAVDELARSLEQQGKPSMQLLPLLSNTGLNAIIVERLKKGQSITALLPFISQETIQRLFEAASTKD